MAGACRSWRLQLLDIVARNLPQSQTIPQIARYRLLDVKVGSQARGIYGSNLTLSYLDDYTQHSFEPVADVLSRPPHSRPSYSPIHTSTATTSPSPTPSIARPHTSAIKKRSLNTLAARRYRQKRVEQVAELETALKDTQRERDALSLRVASLEGEVGVLRQLLSAKK
ncbi:MAG: hypothetical protein M1818_002858 [Claussenomyces sp. TS43310]|nr:MAG: hypothetical protein M1818_002858 [Claussenomyces sp. TS43310]